MNKKILFNILKKIVPWIVYGIVGLFIVITLRSNLSEVKHYEIIRPTFLLLAIFFTMLQFLSNAAVWSILMSFTKAEVTLLDSISVYVSSYIIRYIPGNVWAIAARATLNKEYGVSVMKSIWGWVIENVTYLLVGLAISMFVFLKIDGISEEIGLIVMIALPVCALFILRYELLEKLVRVFARKRFPDSIHKEVEPFSLNYRQRGMLLVLYLVPWFFFSLQFISVALAVEHISISIYLLLAGVNALAWSLGYISLITPSGTGVREGVMIGTLAFLGIVGEVDAIVIAVLARVTSIAGEALFFLLLRGIYLIKGWNVKK